MTLTRDFKQSVLERVQRDPEFARALLDEAATLFLNDEADTARLVLRDLVNATVGFEALAAETAKPAKSLHRMLSKNGNPTMDNLDDKKMAGRHPFASLRAMLSLPARARADREADRLRRQLDIERSKNERVADTLIEHGDALAEARPIQHWAYFPTEEAHCGHRVTRSRCRALIPKYKSPGAGPGDRRRYRGVVSPGCPRRGARCR